MSTTEGVSEGQVSSPDISDVPLLEVTFKYSKAAIELGRQHYSRQRVPGNTSWENLSQRSRDSITRNAIEGLDRTVTMQKIGYEVGQRARTLSEQTHLFRGVAEGAATSLAREALDYGGAVGRDE